MLYVSELTKELETSKHKRLQRVLNSHGIRRGLLSNLGCPILCWREAINGLKGATEVIGTGKTTGGGYLCDRERGLLAQQTGGILHTTSCDEGCQRSVVAALCKSSADAFLRQMKTFHSSMPVEEVAHNFRRVNESAKWYVTSSKRANLIGFKYKINDFLRRKETF